MNNLVIIQLDPLPYFDMKNQILSNAMDKISLDIDFMLLF